MKKVSSTHAHEKDHEPAVFVHGCPYLEGKSAIARNHLLPLEMASKVSPERRGPSSF